MINKNMFISLVIVFLLIPSCSQIDTTRFSCESFIRYSSEPVEDLLKNSNVINVDDKELIFDSLSTKIDSLHLREFPENLLPPIVNSCPDTVVIYTYSKINGIINQENDYIPEKIWFINEKNEVWESSTFTKFNEETFTIDPSKIKFKVEGKPPYLKQISAIIKFKYKEKTYYLKTRNNSPKIGF